MFCNLDFPLIPTGQLAQINVFSPSQRIESRRALENGSVKATISMIINQ